AIADYDKVLEVLRADDWNEYVIRCEGSHIQMWLNGYQTVNYIEEDDSIEATGIIGLQIHGGGPSEAWYRNITIVEL
ncbi:MAG: 3-keto-disaccharide hydrolase, partial [Planctomycetota bacterium]